MDLVYQDEGHLYINDTKSSEKFHFVAFSSVFIGIC